MDNIKGQGTQADAVKSLSVPIKMLEMSKFREAEVMAEQYLRTHSDEGLAYLILYAAKVKSATMKLPPSSSELSASEMFCHITETSLPFLQNVSSVRASLFSTCLKPQLRRPPQTRFVICSSFIVSVATILSSSAGSI